MNSEAVAFAKKQAAAERDAISRLRAKPTSTADTQFRDNEVSRIMLDPEMLEEQKRDALAAVLHKPGSTEQLAAFEADLQAVRERIDTESSAATDTKVMAELKATIEAFNHDLIDIEDRIQPLTDIVEAVDRLIKNKKLLDAFKTIQKNRIGEAEERQRAAELETLETQLNATKSSMFGFGAYVRRPEINQIRRKLEDLATVASETAEAPEGMVDETAKLRNLLDLSSEENQEEHRKLIGSVLQFIATSKERLGAIDGSLAGQATLYDRIYKANNQVTTAYVTLDEGIKLAIKANETDREALPVGEGESQFEKMRREDQKIAIEEHIHDLEEHSTAAVGSFADLTSSAVRIRAQRERNREKRSRVAMMRSRGIAAAAGNLNITLQALGSAAIEQSSEVARTTLNRIIDKTNEITAKESMRAAMGTVQINEEIVKAAKDLAGLGAATRASTDVLRRELTDLHANLSEILDTSHAVRDDLSQAAGVHADVAAGSSPDQKAEKPPVRSPWGI